VVENRCFKDLCIIISQEVSRFIFVMKEDEINSSQRLSSSKREGWKLAMGKPLWRRAVTAQINILRVSSMHRGSTKFSVMN
jgi:hypothetical protein